MTSAPVSSPLRVLAWVQFVLFVALLIAPNLFWLRGWQDSGQRPWLDAIVFPGLLLLLFFALLGKRVWLPCLLLAPFAWLAPLELFYLHRYRNPSDSMAFATAFATNPREIHEYFGSLLIPVCSSVVAVSVLIAGTIWSVWCARLGWRHRSRKVILTILVISPFAIAALAWLTTKPEVRARMQQKTSTLVQESIAKGYPFGVLARLTEYREQRTLALEAAARIEAFRFHARPTRTTAQRQVYVLVIGESSARAHWQLFGYPRETNPELAHSQNIVPITDMVSSWVATAFAVPQLLTRKPYDRIDNSQSEASLLRAMGEAGFETWWISNQFPSGHFDARVAAYANEASHQEFLNHASWSSPGEYDEVLLAPLHRALEDRARNAFVVVHTMGSHTSYDSRYPSTFKRFQPTLADCGLEPSGNCTVNSYDNTIVYTDHVLAEIIAMLRDSGDVSAIWFESDHGEVLPTETCDRFGRWMGSRHEYEIPAFFWFSNAYASAYPDKVAALKANSHQRTLSADTFESLVDMADISFSGHNETHSLFSAAWSYRPRFINYRWTTDYDKATFSGACETLVPDR